MSPTCKTRKGAGFSLMEVIIALGILTAGLLVLTAAMAKLYLTTHHSRYMSTMSLLASEKLEDLNRLPALDPAILVPNGISSGNLTADVTQNVVSGINPKPISYFDTAQISIGDGGITEVRGGQDDNGANGFWVTTHTPDGAANSNFFNVAPALAGKTLIFTRRWLIEQNVPNPGLRRITVRVTLSGTQIPFAQMSTVRP